MSPTPRAALALALLAAGALLLPATAVVALAVVVVAATAADAWLAGRARVDVTRDCPSLLARGTHTPLVATAAGSAAGRTTLRQPGTPDLRVEPAEARSALEARVLARRRGHHELPAVVARNHGPLGLAARRFTATPSQQVTVFPDLPAGRRLALAVRHGRLRDAGRLTRGPLGLGTEFERVRDYLPDDDIRQVNWGATQRMGRPMSNQYRVEQDREIVCLIDTGRLMTAPVGDRTRLDAAVDAATALACVAEVLGDRCGVIAFDTEIRRRVAPRRAAARAVVGAVYDLEPRGLDSDYDLAFRSIRNTKRALVVVFTDLLDESAARGLLDAVPVLASRHAVVVATVRDPDVDEFVSLPPRAPIDVLSAAVAQQVTHEREHVERRLRGAGAEVVHAAAPQLGEACVTTYLRLKERARL